jgi:hypothetical protein
LRRLLWLYFWLLIFEGALRKWIPSLSAPLLIVRDPVVLLIYFQAARCRRFPINRPMLAYFALLVGFILLGLLQIAFGVGGGPVVATYGIRTNFLHLPLIFLIPRVFDYAHVIKIGKWILLLSGPMTLLMAVQFLSPPGSWINATAGGGGEQIGTALGRIRPAGTFSFNTGAAHFYTLATAFVIFGFTGQTKLYSRWLLWVGLFSLLAVLPISGSRSLVLGCALVFFAGIAFALLHPMRARGFLWIGAVILALAAVLPLFSFFREGMLAFLARWDDANASAGGMQNGLGWRFLGGFIEPFTLLPGLNMLGNGIGLGTNVGAMLSTGRLQFLLAEGEWARVVLEAGPLLGFLFLAYRVWVAGILATRSWFACKQGQLLPWLIAGSACLSVLAETISPPMHLGFMVFGAGLCLAAVRSDQRSPAPLRPAKGRQRCL